ncbi:site-specific DNA-methyltransferase [Allosphingosinicella flava]|uniref:Methyltransferase n=2 Tax=Allosphingosinicella flava TaxID=2771430 RepID=A0A7T2GM46_9SPHN|nr:site-specific DNA-methyltransferase [Sphingosinicella flava]
MQPHPDPRKGEIVEGDCIAELNRLESEFVHLIVSDIPYGIAADHWDVLHDNTNSALLGSSPAQQNAGAIFKNRGKPINGWSEADRQIPLQYQQWVGNWAGQWFRVLKPGASAFVFAGRRFSHRCICAMEDAGFSLKDMLAWERPRAAHRAQRLSEVFRRRGDIRSADKWNGWKLGNLRPTFEPILWFVKPYTIGATLADNMLHHGVGAYNDAAFSRYCDKSENVLRIGNAPGEGGLHPTQKPVRLMQALIELASQPDQIVLDPFAGSGTTAVAAALLNRRFIAIEQDASYVKIARKRLENELPSLI